MNIELLLNSGPILIGRCYQHGTPDGVQNDLENWAYFLEDQ